MMHAEIELTGAAEWSPPLSCQSAPEELANSITHGLGLGLSLAGAAILVQPTLRDTTPVTFGCVLYAASLVAVYSASFLSHAVQAPAWRRAFRILDQGFIYLLIAGTYTPYALVYLGSDWWPLTALMWGIALAGCASKIIGRHRIDSVSLALYLVLGWLPVLAAEPLIERLPPGALTWIIAGGLAYTIGTLFLRLDGRYRYFHAVWHVLVIIGSACHFAGIVWYVVPFAAA